MTNTLHTHPVRLVKDERGLYMNDTITSPSNTDHVVDNTTIGIPVYENMIVGSAELDIYGQIAKLTNRVEELARNIAAIECKMERMEEKRSIRRCLCPETHEW